MVFNGKGLHWGDKKFRILLFRFNGTADGLGKIVAHAAV
jgi:hypothetical protein